MPAVETDILRIAYEDRGPADGPVVLLIHGWPDDATTWDIVARALNEVGFRTIIPTLRGFGGTTFTGDNPRLTGNTAIIAMDMIALLDALEVRQFVVAGHDWGANIAEALAVGWSDRVLKMAMLSTPPRLGGLKTPPFWHAQRQWYHWFQATDRGAQAVREDRDGFAHIMWENWSPSGWFDEATFRDVARSFANPAWADVTIHSYRSRWGEADPDPSSVWLEEAVAGTQSLVLPTLFFQGALDGVNPPATTEAIAEKFAGPFERIVLSGVGHFPTRENPSEVAQRLISHFAG